MKLVIYDHASTSRRVSSGYDALPVFPNVLINEVFFGESGALSDADGVLCFFIVRKIIY